MKYRTFSASSGLSTTLLVGAAFAQGALPPGHPPVAPATSASAAPTVSAAAASAAPAASGHPAPSPAAGTPEAPRNPHAGIPRDESAPAPDLPKGSIEATLVSGDNRPLGERDVRLGIMFQRISEGESRSERFARTNAEGRVRFDGLEVGSDYSYRVTTKSGVAEYASTPFPLGDVGQRVLIHVFPVTQELEQAMVGMRGFVYIEPRDDVFVFELLYRVFNVGSVTWVPKDVVVRLPAGFKAFNSQRGMSDVMLEAVEGQGARLKGTITPGQHDLNARFQVPKRGDSSVDFRLGTLPRVAELRVIAEASSQMRLEVDGFEAPQVSQNQQGKRVLVTRKLLEHGDELEQGFTISLSGLPVPGYGRWIAVGLAAGLAGIGLLASRGVLRLDAAHSKSQDLKRARELLLAELVEVEHAKKRSELGPRAYADARGLLLNALARLGKDALEATSNPKKRRRATT
ncbi:MAG: hypothetical protein QM756_22920 [Polyangiaceae bacterium]